MAGGGHQCGRGGDEEAGRGAHGEHRGDAEGGDGRGDQGQADRGETVGHEEVQRGDAGQLVRGDLALGGREPGHVEQLDPDAGGDVGGDHHGRVDRQHQAQRRDAVHGQSGEGGPALGAGPPPGGDQGPAERAHGVGRHGRGQDPLGAVAVAADQGQGDAGGGVAQRDHGGQGAESGDEPGVAACLTYPVDEFGPERGARRGPGGRPGGGAAAREECGDQPEQADAEQQRPDVDEGRQQRGQGGTGQCGGPYREGHGGVGLLPAAGVDDLRGERLEGGAAGPLAGSGKGGRQGHQRQ